MSSPTMALIPANFENQPHIPEAETEEGAEAQRFAAGIRPGGMTSSVSVILIVEYQPYDEPDTKDGRVWVTHPCRLTVEARIKERSAISA